MIRNIIIAAIALSATACYITPAPQTVDEDGRTWVKLSSSESLIPEIQERAEGAGCVDSRALTNVHGVELLCNREKVQILQDSNWLVFHCSSFEQHTCEKLVLSLTTDNRDVGHNAVGGAKWGI